MRDLLIKNYKKKLIMNLKIFDNSLDEDFEISNYKSDIENLYNNILFDLQEYEGDCNDNFAISGREIGNLQVMATRPVYCELPFLFFLFFIFWRLCPVNAPVNHRKVSKKLYEA